MTKYHMRIKISESTLDLDNFWMGDFTAKLCTDLESLMTQLSNDVCGFFVASCNQKL